MSQNWKPKSEAAKAVWLAGFSYSPDQDIIYARMSAWQRQFGYAYSYDLAAPATISAVIDCEPFFFDHDGKHWMIELWKGQYGLETGAEIGVYRSTGNSPLDSILGRRPHDPRNGRFFECARNPERLKMSFTLKRNGNPLFTRGPEVHWWLTGFQWGVLSRPEDLVMELRIEMPATTMRQAFVAAVQGAGYQQVQVSGDWVELTFDRPNTHQPRTEANCQRLVALAAANNSNVVARYQSLQLPNNDPNEIQDDVAGELVEYFASHRPEEYVGALGRALGANGHPPAGLLDALQGLASPSLLSRISNALFGWL
jgi:hypothetical protein